MLLINYMETNYQVKVDFDLLSSYHNHEFDHLSVHFYLYQRIKNMTCAQSPVYKFVWEYKKNESNPGILVTHNKARYTYHKCNSSGTVLTYHCSSKHVTKRRNAEFLFWTIRKAKDMFWVSLLICPSIIIQLRKEK